MSEVMETGNEVVPEAGSAEPMTSDVAGTFEALSSAIQQDVLDAVKKRDMPRLMLVAAYSGEVERLHAAWKQGLPPSGKAVGKRGRKAKAA